MKDGKPAKDEEPVDSDMATMNAQTYAYFTVAYWYSPQEWDGKERVSFFDGRPRLSTWTK